MSHLPSVELATLADAQHDVVSRRQLLALGFTRWQLAANLRADRWRAHGRQTIALHTGPLVDPAWRWFACFEAGPRAALDGVSALEVAGLTGWSSGTIRVSVPRGAPAVRRPGLTVRQTRRWRRQDVVPVGVPRVRVEVAAVRAALWARSDRQAATILAMAVQQRLVTAEAIGHALLDIRRHARRGLVEKVVIDLMDGAQSMGELDFSRLCRRHGLPPADRQVVRRTPRGTAYLDVYWGRYGLVLEIDGIHHLGADAVVADALRQNALILDSDRVLRLPLLGLRVAEDEFVAQVRAGLTAGGWSPPVAS